MRRDQAEQGPRPAPAAWRSLEELAGSPGLLERIAHEFPGGADQLDDPVTRRRFLEVMAASMALVGLGACVRQPDEEIVPYVRAPEEVVPGRPLYFATAVLRDGHAHGVLAESHTGRPTRLEGNPEHPASLGASCALTQAAILDLYDPGRSQAVTRGGRIATLPAFVGAVRTALGGRSPGSGRGLRVLSGPVTSPTLAGQMDALLERHPEARWHVWAPAGAGAASRAGARDVFGEELDTVLSFDRADVVLALDGDVLAGGPGSVRYARDLAARRAAGPSGGAMCRVYAVESTPSLVGAAADHRVALAARLVEPFVRGLAARLGMLPGEEGRDGRLPAAARRLLGPLADDLRSARGRGIVTAGEGQPPRVHALVHAVNHALGNTGATVKHVAPVPVTGTGTLEELAADMDAGRVSTLVVLGANPAYDAPADLDFAALMEKVPLRVHHGTRYDETAARCTWHVPATHELETWSDARAYDGTATILQPLIAPLYAGLSVHEVAGILLGQDSPDGHATVREHWKGRFGEEDFERTWRRALHRGVVEGTAAEARSPSPRPRWRPDPAPAPPPGEALELVLRPSPTVWDGSRADNAWLQELPDPLTTLTWGNAALLAPETASRLGVTDGDVLRLALGGRSVEGPALVLPGQSPECVTLHLGHGRTRAGPVGGGVGFDAGRLRTTGSLWSAGGLAVERTGRRERLAVTQHHNLMENRGLVKSATLEDFRRDPGFAHEEAHHHSLLPERSWDGHAWGMSIDLTRCIGCNACVVACQSENSIPVVGREQVLVGREMHWIRVDRYFTGEPDAPGFAFQPVPCMHCENAPCEPVCPVGATVHGEEGLNEMVYNRCVGTRYCANNCPYKVRRFNFLEYHDRRSPTLELMRNPDVTVRRRGVMEKCTYCVQRINAARITAKKEGRRIEDGEVVTACQSACPTEAIVFGDVNDPQSRVSRAKAGPRDYTLLPELNTRPRTSYAARVSHPNPELER